MMKLSVLLLVSFCSFGFTTRFNPLLPRDLLQRRQNGTNSTSNLQVDLGYSIYEGYKDNKTGLSLWKGIRYAAPPTGKLRVCKFPEHLIPFIVHFASLDTPFGCLSAPKTFEKGIETRESRENCLIK